MTNRFNSEIDMCVEFRDEIGKYLTSHNNKDHRSLKLQNLISLKAPLKDNEAKNYLLDMSIFTTAKARNSLDFNKSSLIIKFSVDDSSNVINDAKEELWNCWWLIYKKYFFNFYGVHEQMSQLIHLTHVLLVCPNAWYYYDVHMPFGKSWIDSTNKDNELKKFFFNCEEMIVPNKSKDQALKTILDHIKFSQ